MVSSDCSAASRSALRRSASTWAADCCRSSSVFSVRPRRWPVAGALLPWRVLAYSPVTAPVDSVALAGLRGPCISPNPPKGYGGGVDTGDDGYGKANGPGPVPIDGVEGSARWPRQWPGGGRQWRRPAKTARRHAGSGTGGLGWHEFAGQPLGLSGGRVGRRRRAVRLVGEWRAIGPGRN